LKDVSSRTGFNKSTAYHYLVHLEHAGYSVRNGSNAFVLSMKFIEITTRGYWVEGLLSLARPYLMDLRRQAGETTTANCPSALKNQTQLGDCTKTLTEVDPKGPKGVVTLQKRKPRIAVRP
jgi:hypothetical protein